MHGGVSNLTEEQKAAHRAIRDAVNEAVDEIYPACFPTTDDDGETSGSDNEDVEILPPEQSTRHEEGVPSSKVRLTSLWLS